LPGLIVPASVAPLSPVAIKNVVPLFIDNIPNCKRKTEREIKN
jgi:hypothetical protein